MSVPPADTTEGDACSEDGDKQPCVLSGRTPRGRPVFLEVNTEKPQMVPASEGRHGTAARGPCLGGLFFDRRFQPQDTQNK